MSFASKSRMMVSDEMKKSDIEVLSQSQASCKKFVTLFQRAFPGSGSGSWDLVDYSFNYRNSPALGRIRIDQYDVLWTNPWTNEEKILTLDLKRLKIIDRDNEYLEQETIYHKLVRDKRGILSLFVVCIPPLVLQSEIPSISMLACQQNGYGPDSGFRQCPYEGTIDSWCLIHHGNPNSNHFYKRQLVHSREKKQIETNDLFRRAQLTDKTRIYVFENVFGLRSPEEEDEEKKKEVQRARLKQEEMERQNIILQEEEEKEKLRKETELAEEERIKREGLFKVTDFPQLDTKPKKPKASMTIIPSSERDQSQAIPGTRVEPNDHFEVFKKSSRRTKFTKVNLADFASKG